MRWQRCLRRLHDLGRELEGRPPRKWERAGSHLVQQHSKGPQIAGSSGRLALQHFRRHVGERAAADGGCGSGGRGGFRRRGAVSIRQAKVHDLDAAFLGNQHVRAFQIAVNDASLVRVREGFGHLDAVVEHFVQAQSLFGNPIAQPPAIHELHDDEVVPADLIDAVDRADPWMSERRCRARLEQKLVAQGAASGLGQNLDGDRSVELLIAGAVDHPHRAGADDVEDGVVPERGPGSQWRHGGRSNRLPVICAPIKTFATGSRRRPLLSH